MLESVVVLVLDADLSNVQVSFGQGRIVPTLALTTFTPSQASSRLLGLFLIRLGLLYLDLGSSASPKLKPSMAY